MRIILNPNLEFDFNFVFAFFLFLLQFNVCRVTLLGLILACCLLSEAQGHCSLEKMKTFAREACERLFQQDEGREKRSIGYGHNDINGFGRKYFPESNINQYLIRSHSVSQLKGNIYIYLYYMSAI